MLAHSRMDIRYHPSFKYYFFLISITDLTPNTLLETAQRMVVMSINLINPKSLQTAIVKNAAPMGMTWS